MNHTRHVPLRYCIWLFLTVLPAAIGTELPRIFHDAPPFKDLKPDDMAWRMNLWDYGITAEGGAYIVVHDDKFEIWTSQFKLNPKQPETSDRSVKIPDLEKSSPPPP